MKTTKKERLHNISVENCANKIGLCMYIAKHGLKDFKKVPGADGVQLFFKFNK